ncbi:probable pterin-4-alpha-carbinolamine dehydratase, chloroplastic [Andrographis paniculata]|uniref:probable pterin-4-alpha-carbinolamine dehydratase, chloroplastic n=1 Tax=Andrographis paniculata TaxID=175694 RepID=UPI0021E8ADE6|nr:probable pterin-4-alpha-carbinolamine dehydratase, chloroplastic [Andrographis paniculata]
MGGSEPFVKIDITEPVYPSTAIPIQEGSNSQQLWCFLLPATMALAPHVSSCSLMSLSKAPLIQKKKPRNNLLPFIRSRNLVKVRASAPDLLGDFGARDPFPAELESNFAEKVQGNVDTEHKILIPTSSALSLAQRDCVPVSEIQQPLSEDEAKKLLLKVVGWRLVDEEGCLKLKGLWKVRDVKCGEELINRINKCVESTGHLPTVRLEDESNQVTAELWTSAIGGLSINDFIVAAKIDTIKVSDLQPRLRVWA